MYATEALILVAKSTFTPMDEFDRECFSGVESEEALISHGDEFSVILDGTKICVINHDGEESIFEVGENIFA